MKKIIILLLVSLLVPSLALAASPTKSKTTKPSVPVVTNIVVPEEEAVIKAYENTLPAVVSIIVSRKLTDIFGTTSVQDVGGGTGFFISTDGYIVTNKHVVANDNVDYTVITSAGKEYVASVLARDPAYDIAIVKIEGNGFTPAKLGNSDKIRIGQTVIAIGNVLAEFRNTVTRGIVSGIGRTISATGGGISETIENAIQTDASINPGNSGGPLVNMQGGVIGMNTAINRAGEALGFAIPINIIHQTVNNFLQHGRIVHSYLGVRYVMLNKNLARANNLRIYQGAFVLLPNLTGGTGVVPGSPAAAADIQPGDIILAINNEILTANKSLSGLITKYKPGDQITLKVLRAGREIMLKATLTERPTTDN